ncbi:autophagy-related protein 2-like isoform X1 [Populus alba x Populus x berolinensis]|nr:autophagy-related protein 2-like isoform X1 [Populus alba x Populus x berolinensis]
MFSWNFAKSAEAVLSRWAMKRLCKFVLKKKLGKFILGDIDLDQLDVQLAEGTIQLCDLALNVDCLNEKFGAAASVMIKEGSIGSLLVKMPWKGKGFQVEVDELELVLAPCLKKRNSPADDETSSSSQESRHGHKEVGRFGNELMENAQKSSFVDVHEGVKTIAKVVKWFLTSFHVKVKKLIVAYEPYFEKDEKKVGCQETLVLRVPEIECGTCVSEDANLSSDERVENFLGISQLMNFVKFQGAVLELLKTDGVDNQSCRPCVSDSTFSEQFSGRCQSKPTTPIVTGKKDGFSGNLKLSIPWKNGSLDIHKLDAEVCVDPVELRLQPSTIKWFLLSWETYKNIDQDGRGDAHYKSTESVYFNSSSHFHSSLSIPGVVANDKVSPVRGRFTSALSSFTGKESVSEAMLPGSHLISDWVPNSIQNEKDGIQEELDLGASVDQFFECLDGMRSSQSALGSSGMWNWTCSVFSALTAASSLASGSFQIPSEDQHVQTTLKATLAGVSVLLSFQDEDQEYLCGQKSDQNTVGLEIRCLSAECKDIFVVLQVCPQEMRFEGTVKCIEVIDYLYDKNDGNSQTVLIQNLQSEVQCVLPPFPHSDELGTLIAPGVPFGSATKMKLLGTSGVTRCQFTVYSDSSDGNFTGTKSFSLQLPFLIFWVNFASVNVILNLLKNAEKSVERSIQRNGFPSVNKKHESSHGNMKKGSSSRVSTLASTENLQGSISILKARVILCFPFVSGGDIGGHSPWNQFIAVDICSPSILESPTSNSSSWKSHAPRAICSLHLNVSNLKVYLVNPACNDDGTTLSTLMPRYRFCAHQIVSVSNRAGCLCTISMLWQEDPVTGPWIAEKVKSLATSEESRSRKKIKVKGYEFASATAAKDLGDINLQTREELILSSAFFLHVHLLPVVVDLSSSQYRNLHCLLDQMINGLSGMACDVVGVRELSPASQTSILVKCESVDFSIRPDMKDDIKSSLQSELPGSWHCLKLKIQKFDMLSVSNIGGIRSANFFWLAHGEGKLWGSITGVPDQEFLLISCSNSTMKRGDGGGSNALSSSLAGSEIIHIWDPKSSHDFTSVSVRCATVIAVGGRLDWLDAISSFFILPSPKVEKANNENLAKGDLNAPSETSFILKLVDIGISYEPYLKKSVVRDLHSESGSSYSKEETGEPRIACLLAASLFSLSNTTMEDSIDSDYKIRVQDVGLLLGAAHENIGGTHSVEYLHKMGYVRVAHEALVEAILRTDCKNGLLWEVECTKSHIYVETCHDTTRGLMCLAAQFQQLYAPDLEESIVHLQNRWNGVCQSQERNEFNDEGRISNHDCAPSTSQVHAPTADTKSNLGVVGLMDEICEDAFHLHGIQACRFDSSGSEIHVSLDESLLGEACSLSVETPDFFSNDLSYDWPVPLIGLESNQTTFLQSGSFPEFIEGYCVSDLRPLSELSMGRQSPPEKLKCISKNFGNADHGRGNGGWYGDAPLSIVEHHISGASEATVDQVLEDQLPTLLSERSDDFGKATGRVLFKNIDVSWRMYAGSDWQAYRKNSDPSSHTCGRDTTVCLELALCGMQFQYNVFPVGGVCASKLCLTVQDFHLSDKSKTAPWKQILGYYHSKDHPRESTSKAFKLDLEAVRPDPLIPLEEYRLRITLLPLLLHLHQSQLDFLISFFEPKSFSAGQSSDQDQNSDGVKTSATNSCNLAGHTIANEALLPFFQKFEIWPIILRVDYSPHHVDLAALSSGKYVELVNLVPWKGVELQLKHVHAVGVYGWGSVCETIIGEWLVEISRNQMHKILRGLPTVRSLVAVGSGAAKLVSLPVESYRKDHKIIKGMQRGTSAFLKSISLEAVGFGVHLAAGAHDILLQAEYILTNIPSPPVSWSVQAKTKENVRCNQPKDAQQGIQHAYESLSDGLGKSASALVQTPLKKYQHGASTVSALATAVRAVPAAAIAPVSACAGAVHYALLGLRNSLDPEHKKESMEKYLGSSKPNDWD